METQEHGTGWTLYTAGYRDPEDARRLPPEVFYAGLPAEAAVVDIRSHPYSPFAPAYTGSGVAAAVARWKPDCTACYHVGELGNTNKGPDGKRVNPPILRDPENGYARLEKILADHRSAVIVCACSLATFDDPRYRCHRFHVAEAMRARLPGLRVVHLPEDSGAPAVAEVGRGT